MSWTFLEAWPAALVAVQMNSPVSFPEGEVMRRLPSESREKAGPPTYTSSPPYKTNHSREGQGPEFVSLTQLY